MKNTLSNLQNAFFFFFVFFWPLLLSTLITFLLILNDLKCYKSTTWSSTNHLGTLIAREQHTRNFLSVQELAFVVLGGLFCWVLDPLYFEVLTFPFLIYFWWLLVCQMHEEERFKFCSDTKNNGALPWTLKCLFTSQCTLV